MPSEFRRNEKSFSLISRNFHSLCLRQNASAALRYRKSEHRKFLRREITQYTLEERNPARYSMSARSDSRMRVYGPPARSPLMAARRLLRIRESVARSPDGGSDAETAGKCHLVFLRLVLTFFLMRTPVRGFSAAAVFFFLSTFGFTLGTGGFASFPASRAETTVSSTPVASRPALRPASISLMRLAMRSLSGSASRSRRKICSASRGCPC